MKMKLWMVIGTLVASAVLAACTPAGTMPPGLTKAAGAAGTDQLTETEVSTEPAPALTETAEATETMEPTEAPMVTETPEVDETEEATDDGTRAGCPGNPGGTPPTAGKLATANNVSEDEVMGWFCKGFGFGEIKKAYVWAASTGKTVDELFALKAEGMGWGEIAHSLDIKPGGKPCWAGSDHGASDPNCVKPGKSKDNQGNAAKNDKGNNGNAGNANGSGNGNGNGKGNKSK